ncbi:alpha/beta fold hydrolase [Microbacterium sp.]|jgi:pimeloyl-ACP methyl ester carboxylesterase|uniref:alpha/beta fold hydrolase n=1 Tax=Microbacterium sp. TaxID=51671 RepID=UPI0037CC1FFA
MRQTEFDIDGGRFRAYSSIAPRTGGSHFDADLPVVLIHGIGMSQRYFVRLHDEFARTRDVHSIDLPGFGRFGRPREPFEQERMARALAEVLVQLNVPRAVLVGHSMGAQWVVELARQRPDLAAGVVLIGPVADDEHRTLRAQSVALALDTLGELPLVNSIVFADYIRCGMPWYLTQLRHMMAYPTEERVAELSAPVLVLRGGNDPVAGLEWCRRLRDRARDGSLVNVPGHRHVVQFAGARAVASAIDAFLAQNHRVDREREPTI